MDNVPALAANANVGRETVERCRTLLRQVGLSLKDQPEEEYLINLTAGKTTELLGFNVSLSNGRLKYGITDTAKDTLESRLLESYDTANSPATVRSVLDGWLHAMAPAFDSSRVSILTKEVLDNARKLGFSEFAPEHVARAWSSSWDRWTRKVLQPAWSRAEQRANRV